MTAKRKRPKVRYVVDECVNGGYVVFHLNKNNQAAVTNRLGFARRIAAALNLYEAVRRGEV